VLIDTVMEVSYNRNTDLAWTRNSLCCRCGAHMLLRVASELERGAHRFAFERERNASHTRVEVETRRYSGSHWSWNTKLLRPAWVSRLVLNSTLTLSSWWFPRSS